MLEVRCAGWGGNLPRATSPKVVSVSVHSLKKRRKEGREGSGEENAEGATSVVKQCGLWKERIEKRLMRTVRMACDVARE
jgi:hypothetical protein